MVMPPEITIVNQFKGMNRGLRTGFRSGRRDLDEPKDLRNAIIDENGSLWFPSGPRETIHTFTALDDGIGTSTRVSLIVNITNPATAILFQVGTRVFYKRTQSDVTNVMNFLVDVGSEDPVWVVEVGGVLYFGNRYNTWKVDTDTFTWAATLLDNLTVLPGFHSYMYKGRRFIIERTDIIRYSDLNSPEVFGENSWFTVGGDSSGGSWSTDPGSVICFSEYDDYLVIFCTQSIWLFTGTIEETFQLRRTNALTGAWARDSVVRVEGGILFFGGTPRGEFGVYMFTGGNAELVSAGLTAFFRRWEQLGQWGTGINIFEQATRYINAVRWNDNYILAGDTIRTVEYAGDDAREIYAYNFRTNSWTTFDGWADGPRVGLARDNPDADSLLLSKGLTVYTTFEALCRAPGQRGRFLLGWIDHGHAAGHHRFLGVKVSGWKSEAYPTNLTLTAYLPSGIQVASTQLLQNQVFEGIVFPLNLRGSGIELEFEITYDATNGDATDVVIEQVQLIRSTKGEKLSNV